MVKAWDYNSKTLTFLQTPATDSPWDCCKWSGLRPWDFPRWNDSSLLNRCIVHLVFNNTVKSKYPKIMAYFYLSYPASDEIRKNIIGGGSFPLPLCFECRMFIFSRSSLEPGELGYIFQWHSCGSEKHTASLLTNSCIPKTSTAMNNFLFPNSSTLSKLCWY